MEKKIPKEIKDRVLNGTLTLSIGEGFRLGYKDAISDVMAWISRRKNATKDSENGLSELRILKQLENGVLQLEKSDWFMRGEPK